MYNTDISPTKYADVMGLGWALKGNSQLYGTSWDSCGVLSIQNGKVNQQNGTVSLCIHYGTMREMFWENPRHFMDIFIHN